MEVYATHNSISTPNISQDDLSREEVRAMLTEEGTAFKVLAACNRAYGPYAGPMVQRLLHLDGKGFDPDDWIYKPEHEWEKEVGHTRWFQRKGRKAAIRAGVWEEEKRGIPAKNWYRLNIWKVWADVAPYLDGPQNGESISQAHKGSAQVGHVKEPSKSDTYSDPTITERQQEKTAESRDSSPDIENELEVQHEEAHDSVKKVPSFSRVEEIPEPPTHVTVTWLDRPVTIEKLLAHFDTWFGDVGVPPLGKYERRRYGWEIVAILEEHGADKDTLLNVMDRVTHRTCATATKPCRLTPLQAYRDEIAGGPIPPVPVRPPKPRSRMI